MSVPNNPQAIQIAIIVFENCMASAVSGLLDALTIANTWASKIGAATRGVFEIVLLGPEGNSTIRSGYLLIPYVPLSQAGYYDILIVPPILGPVVEVLQANRRMIAWLAMQRANVRVMASVCAGAFFLAEAGLLTDRKATTNPVFAGLFRQLYPDIKLLPEQRLIDQGDVLCAGSTTAFLNLATYLIDRFVGHEIAVLTAKTLCVDKNHHSQLPYYIYIAPKDHGDTAVLEQQSWMEQNFTRTINVADLASRGAMSERSLHRRFVTATGLSPIDYLNRIRIEAAKRQLESSDLSIEQLTTAVGCQDTRAFTRLFKNLCGLSPREYRVRFGMR